MLFFWGFVSPLSGLGFWVGVFQGCVAWLMLSDPGLLCVALVGVCWGCVLGMMELFTTNLHESSRMCLLLRPAVLDR